MFKISVIIPVHNRTELLRRAVRSVVAQTLQPFEIVVVDDGSDPDAAEATRALCAQIQGARLIRHARNLGAAAARNTGIAHVHGDYIAFLDSDDEWLANKLQIQRDFLLQTGAKVCACSFHYMRLRQGAAPMEETRHPATLHSVRSLVWGCTICPGSGLVISKALAAEVGPQDATLRRYEDWDWLIRLTARGYAVPVLRQPLIRIHTSSYVPFADVDEACRLFQAKHDRTFRSFGLVAGLKFRSTLQIERASYALKSGQFARASGHTVCGIALWPLRNRHFWAAALRSLLQGSRA